MPRQPAVALLRGEALNPFEMQAYGPLTDRFDLLAVGRRQGFYEVSGLPMPTVLLHSAGQLRSLRALHRRAGGRFPGVRDPDRLLGLRRAVAGRQILHAAETVLPVTEQAAELGALTGAKLVLTCWETIPFRYDDDPVLAARKTKVKQATSLFIAVTERARDALCEEGVAAQRIRVVPAAVDCQRFRPALASDEVRRSWDVPDRAPVILYVGRLIQEKGLVELVRAFARVGHSDAHLVLIGSGDQTERVRIAAAAGAAGSRVRVLAGMPYEVLPAIYSSADLVVAPSLTTPYWEEQFGMVLAETMACARPLVTTASGAIPEVVGDAAELVAPYDVGALAATMQRLLADPARREQLAAAGRARAEALYDVSVVAPQLASVYDDLLAS